MKKLQLVLALSFMSMPAWAGLSGEVSKPSATVQADGVVPLTQAQDSTKAKELYKQGVKYYIGDGVKQDYSKAAALYRQAADLGDPMAQSDLGVMYENGRGVAQDDTQAVSWYRKAAEQGYAGGQYNLGVMYKNGRGVAQDYTQAVSWYRKAAEQGYTNAQSNLGIMYENGRGVAQDYGAAINWYLAAADQHNAPAINNLGAFFDRGDYTDKNLPLAYALFNLAASYDSLNQKYAENRNSTLRELERSDQVVLGQQYTRRLANSKDFNATLMEIIKPKAKAKAAKKK